MQNNLEEKLSAIECESGTVKVHRNNIKKCVLHTMSDLIVKVDRKARQPWITQDEWRNELKRATDKVKKESSEHM